MLINSFKAYEKYPDSFAIVNQLIDVLTEGAIMRLRCRFTKNILGPNPKM